MMHFLLVFLLVGCGALYRAKAAYSHCRFALTVCWFVCLSVCLSGSLWQNAHRIWMRFGMVGHPGPGMRQVVGFGDRFRGKG